MSNKFLIKIEYGQLEYASDIRSLVELSGNTSIAVKLAGRSQCCPLNYLSSESSCLSKIHSYVEDTTNQKSMVSND